MGAGGPVGRGAVFLDRDGVINTNVFNPASGEYEAPLTAADFALAPGAVEGLLKLQAAGFPLFVVSNQPNYAKGKSTLADHYAIDVKMRAEMAWLGIVFARIDYCLHHPDGVVPEYFGACACRKPSPYFLLRAMWEFGLDAAQSWMVGDRESDILCGHAAGVRTILIRADHQKAAADFLASDLAAAADLICNAAKKARVPHPSRVLCG